jgi:hypothetical protein
LLTILASRSLSTTSASSIATFIGVVVVGARFLVGAAAEAYFRVEAEAAVDHQCEQEAAVGDCRNLPHLAVPAGVDLYSVLEELPAKVPVVVVAENDPEPLVQAFLDS